MRKVVALSRLQVKQVSPESPDLSAGGALEGFGDGHIVGLDSSVDGVQGGLIFAQLDGFPRRLYIRALYKI
jgi:hypothetical protein